MAALSSAARHAIHAVSAPACRTTVALAINYAVSRDLMCIVGIGTYWITKIMPVVMANVQHLPMKRQIATEVLWIDICVCLYCIALPLHERPLAAYNFWLWVQAYLLAWNVMLMLVAAATADTATTLLLHGSYWGVCLQDVFTRVYMCINKWVGDFCDALRYGADEQRQRWENLYQQERRRRV